MTIFLTIIFCFVIIILLNMGFRQITGNFHEVIPGEFYRSAQPNAEDISQYREDFGIRTIINLRNEARTDWYKIEEQSARDNDVTLINFPMSSANRASMEDMQRLASIMAQAPKPILVHCEHGSNRTGLASAIYLWGKPSMPKGYADAQMSPFYGHVPIPGIGRYNLFRSWLEFRKSQRSTRA